MAPPELQLQSQEAAAETHRLNLRARVALVLSPVLLTAACMAANAEPSEGTLTAQMAPSDENPLRGQQQERFTAQRAGDCPVNLTGHRGWVDLPRYDENTPKTARRALRAGADATEFDVRMLKKPRGARFRNWVAIHDPTWQRTTNGRGRVDRTLPRQANRLRTRDRSHVVGVGTMLRTVRQAGPQKAAQIEIKNQRGINERSLRRLVGLVRARRMLSRVMFTSAENHTIRVLRGVVPGAPIGRISHGRVWPSLDGVPQATTVIMADKAVVNEERVRAAHARGFLVSARSVVPADVQRLLDAGADNRLGESAVDNIVTDHAGSVYTTCANFLLLPPEPEPSPSPSESPTPPVAPAPASVVKPAATPDSPTPSNLPEPSPSP